MSKIDLFLAVPYVNAAGSLGFAPDLHGPVDWKRLGAFVTNPVSLEGRRSASKAACLVYPGGFLLHTGYPNPGLKKVIDQFAYAWERSPLPVVVAILLQQFHQLPEFFKRLEGLPGIAGVEVSLPVEAQAGDLKAILEMSIGELAVILRLPLDRALELLPPGDGERLLEIGLAAISLGPPRGVLPDSACKLVSGRLYGPALFPQTLATVRKLVKQGLPVIAGPGVYSASQAGLLLKNGVLAVELDAALWIDPSFIAWAS